MSTAAAIALPVRPQPEDWAERAECRRPTALWVNWVPAWEEDPMNLAAAREVCGACPVRAACLGDALRGMGDDGRPVHGIWAGTTTRERRGMMRRQR